MKNSVYPCVLCGELFFCTFTATLPTYLLNLRTLRTMPNVNLALFATYNDAKKAYFEKLPIVEASVGKKNASGRSIKNGDVRAIKNEMEGAFMKLDRSAVWNDVIEFDNAKLMEQIATLRSFGNDDFADILQQMVSLEALLETILIAKRSSAENAPVASAAVVLESTGTAANNMNAEVRNALLLADRKIDQRISQFEAAGIDLLDDPEFPAMEDRHTDLVDKYDSRLLANSITGTAADRDTLNAAGNDLTAAPDVPQFKDRYNRLDAFIQSKLGGA